MPAPLPTPVRTRALALLGEGWSLRAVGRELGVHHTTVAWWRDGGADPVDAARRGLGRAPAREVLRTWPLAGARTRDHWAHLLGIYLGDGYVDPDGRLRVYCDLAYPGIIDEVDRTMRSLGVPRVWHGRQPGCRVLVTSTTGWPELLPTGAGRKHTYSIRPSGWLAEALASRPHLVLRGLIQSDGCRFTNRVVVGGRRYAYPTYDFSNRSADVLGIFEMCCRALGIRPTPLAGEVGRRVARRADVARLDLVVGAKR